MPEYVRVTDDVKPKRTYSILKSQFREKVHELVESDRDQATYADGTPRPPRHYTTVDAEAKKKTSASTEAAKKTAAKPAETPEEK